MDTQKSKESIFVDRSAIAKSAAWAWFQHGSESNERPVRESDVWRPKIEPIPSRYKLEALKNLHNLDHGSSSNSPGISLSRSRRSCQNSLLDNYEIERISRQLEYYVGLSRPKRQSRDSGGGTVAEVAADHEVMKRNNSKVVGQKKKTTYDKGFESRHVASCGSSSDDVTGQRRRLAGKSRVVAVVDVVGCRPRPRPWGLRV